MWSASFSNSKRSWTSIFFTILWSSLNWSQALNIHTSWGFTLCSQEKKKNSLFYFSWYSMLKTKWFTEVTVKFFQYKKKNIPNVFQILENVCFPTISCLKSKCTCYHSPLHKCKISQIWNKRQVDWDQHSPITQSVEDKDSFSTHIFICGPAINLQETNNQSYFVRRMPRFCGNWINIREAEVMMRLWLVMMSVYFMSGIFFSSTKSLSGVSCLSLKW